MQMYLGEEGKKYYWRVVDVSNITDVQTLETKFDLTEEMAKYVLDSNERARVEYDGKNLLVTIPRIFIFSFNALSSIFIVGTNLSKTLKGIPMLLGTFILFNASSISLTLVVFVIYPPNIAIKVILDAK